MNRPHGRGVLTLLFLLLYLPFVYDYGFRYLRASYTDFPSFYWAAHMAFVEGRSPYDFQHLEQLASGSTPHVYPYLYPPTSLLTFYPFTFFSYTTAKIVMLAINHVMVLLFLHLFLFRIKQLGEQPVLVAFGLVYVFAYYPIPVTLHHGQVNLVVLWLLCLAWYALKTTRPARHIAWPLSLAILVKSTPALVLVYLGVKKQYRAVMLTLALLALYAVVALILLPWQVWGEWLTRIAPSGGYGRVPLDLFSPAAPWNQSINGFTARLFLENEFSQPLFPSATLGRIVPYTLCIALLMITLLPMRRLASRGPINRHLEAEFSLVLAAMFLVSPASWEHHLVWLLPSALCALFLAMEGHHRGARLLLALVALCAFAVAWPLRFASPLLANGLLTLGISVKMYAVAGLWLYLLVDLWSRE